MGLKRGLYIILFTVALFAPHHQLSSCSDLGPSQVGLPFLFLWRGFGLCMKQKSRSKLLPWPTLGPGSRMAANIATILPHTSIHCSMGSWPVGVQCPLTSSLGEFLGYWAGSGILGYRPCWCPSPFSLPSISWCFSIHLPLDFIRVSSLRPTYLHPFGRPFTYSLFR